MNNQHWPVFTLIRGVGVGGRVAYTAHEDFGPDFALSADALIVSGLLSDGGASLSPLQCHARLFASARASPALEIEAQDGVEPGV